jgi:hypothetical protein
MVLAVTVAGCNRFPDNGLQIAANLPPNDSCVVTADQDIRLLRGLYDLGYRSASGQPRDYVIAPLLKSYLTSATLEFQGEVSNLQVHNFDITLLLPDGSAPALPEGLVNPYRVNTSAAIPGNEQGGGSTEEVAAAIGIPASYQDALRTVVADTGFTSVLLDIRAVGTTAGGFTQTSGSFSWPVDLCDGCLEICTTTEDELNASCLPGQDVWPYCRCGDDTAEPPEVCDGTDLTGQDCVSQGFSGGTLTCLSDCSGFDTSACTP